MFNLCFPTLEDLNVSSLFLNIFLKEEAENMKAATITIRNFPSLQKLSLDRIRQIKLSSLPPSLTELILFRCDQDILATGKLPSSLTRLSVSCQTVELETVKTIVGSNLTVLRDLELIETYLGKEEVEILAGASWPFLERLNVRSNQMIGNSGLITLLSNRSFFASLKHLSVFKCNLDGENIDPLWEPILLSSLTYLDMNFNNLGEGGLSSSMRSFKLPPSLKILDIGRNLFTSNDTAFILRFWEIPQSLVHLNLESAVFDDETLEILTALDYPALETIVLKGIKYFKTSGLRTLAMWKLLSINFLEVDKETLEGNNITQEECPSYFYFYDIRNCRGKSWRDIVGVFTEI